MKARSQLKQSCNPSQTLHRTAAGLERAKKQLQKRRFARAIASDQAQRLARMQRKRAWLKRLVHPLAAKTVVFAQALGHQNRRCFSLCKRSLTRTGPKLKSR